MVDVKLLGLFGNIFFVSNGKLLLNGLFGFSGVVSLIVYGDWFDLLLILLIENIKDKLLFVCYLSVIWLFNFCFLLIFFFGLVRLIVLFILLCCL